MSLTVPVVAWVAMGLAVVAMAGIAAFCTALLTCHRHRVPRPSDVPTESAMRSTRSL